MKIAITADIHLHNYSDFNEVDSKGNNSRLTRITDCLREMAKIAKQKGAKVFLIAGDLFHSRKAIPPTVLHHASQTIAEIKFKYGMDVVCLGGNHDMSSTGDGTLSIYALSGLMRIVDDPRDYMEIGGVKFGFLPYVEDPMEARIAVKEMVGQCKYLIAHVGLDQALAGPTDYEIPGRITLTDLQTDMFLKVYLGHYHKRQEVSNNAWYVGSPLQHNFGERDDVKGFYILDTDDNTHEFIENTWSSKFKRLDITDESSEKEALLDSAKHFVEMRYVGGFQPSRESDTKRVRVKVQTVVENKQRIDFGGGTDGDIIKAWIEHKNPDIEDLEKLEALGLEFLQMAKAEEEA